MRLYVVTFLSVVVCSLAPSSASAQSASVLDRFVGTWKEDESKRQMGSEAPLMFRRAATGLEEARGGANPQYQPVIFDGKPRPTTTPGRTIAWKQIDPNTFQRTLSQDSKLLTTRDLRIVGTTLTETTATQLLSGGTRKVTMTYERADATGEGLLGRWIPKTFKSDTPATQRYARSGTGLKVTGDGGAVETLTFDGKPVPITGGSVIGGTATTAKMVDDRTIEAVSTRGGVRLGRTRLVISPDGKTLTQTFTAEGPDSTGKPTVSVFVKQ